MTTTIRTTCSNCQVTDDAPSTAVILTLPAVADNNAAAPSFMHLCPSCRSCDVVSVPWRTATYLLTAGTTTLTAPDVEQVRPQYREQRPTVNSPMAIDDLIDLHAYLATATN